MKILILCTGNSCRSQMAEGFLKSFDNRLEVSSAGTQASGKLSSRAVKVMKELDIDISGNTSDPVENYMNEYWDYVITVCKEANETCPAFFGNVQHRLHIGFDDPTKVEGSDEFVRTEFLRVRNEIKAAFMKFYIEELKPQLNEVSIAC